MNSYLPYCCPTWYLPYLIFRSQIVEYILDHINEMLSFLCDNSTSKQVFLLPAPNISFYPPQHSSTAARWSCNTSYILHLTCRVIFYRVIHHTSYIWPHCNITNGNILSSILHITCYMLHNANYLPLNSHKTVAWQHRSWCMYVYILHILHVCIHITYITC